MLFPTGLNALQLAAASWELEISVLKTSVIPCQLAAGIAKS